MHDPESKNSVFAHACSRFPDLVPSGAFHFDDVPFVDKARAVPWYGRPIEGARYFASTGTSGHPKPVPWISEEDAWYVDEKQELFAPWIDGSSRAFVSLATGHNADSAMIVLRKLGIEVHDAGLTPLGEQCAAITEFAPELLYCSPSILARLIAALDDAGERARSVQRIITNGEVLFPSARARAESYFGLSKAAVMDTYGSTEIGTIAYTCWVCGVYHLLDGLYPEATPAAVADLGDLVGWPSTTVLSVSSLKRTSFPVIRFVTYDIVQGLRSETCAGKRRFSFDRILGRCDDVLNYGELFSTYDLADLIGHCLPGARWLVFNPDNAITLVIEGIEPDGFREALRSRYPLHSRLTDLGLLEPPTIGFVRDFDRLAAEAGLPTGRSSKAIRHILHRTPDPLWLEEQDR